MRAKEFQNAKPAPRKALVVALEPEETHLAYAEGLVRTHLHIFKNCAFALTEQRLLLFCPVWPVGYGLDAAYDRASCSMSGYKMRLDGSRMFLLDHGKGVRCLYFGRAWRGVADAIYAAVSPQAAREQLFTGWDAMQELAALGG